MGNEKRERENNVRHFLNLIQESKRGKFKLYIGMIAGVGKTFRMLSEAHTLLDNGINVKIGYVETHSRRDTTSLLDGLPIVPRKTIFYKGKELNEMDTQAIISLNPDVVIVDELAHTNAPGCKNEKRWQDVLDILDAGINVISAVNIQHIESLNEEVRNITGVEVRERIPDRMVTMADEVVNIDLAAEDLITRLKEGKIYPKEKIPHALNNFFKSDNILQLREMALREVSGHVVRKVDTQVFNNPSQNKHMRFMACIESNGKKADNIIRKTARLAGYYNSDWFVLYVQIPKEQPNVISLERQRRLINSFKLVAELGGELIQVKQTNVPETIAEQAMKNKISTICIGQPKISFLQIIFKWHKIAKLINKLKIEKIDLIILS